MFQTYTSSQTSPLPLSTHDHLQGTRQAGWTCIFLRKSDTTRYLNIWVKQEKETPSFPKHTQGTEIWLFHLGICATITWMLPTGPGEESGKAKHCYISKTLLNQLLLQTAAGQHHPKEEQRWRSIQGEALIESIYCHSTWWSRAVLLSLWDGRGSKNTIK